MERLEKRKPKGSSSFPKFINPQLYFFREGRRMFVYSPFSNECTVLSNEEYNFLMENPELKGKPSDKKFVDLIMSFLYVDSNWFRRSSSEESRLGDVATLSLITTTLCNLRCRYCFIFGGEKNKIIQERKLGQIPSIIDAKAAIYAIEELKPKTVLLFGWGEPTMAFKIIRLICNSIDTKNIKINLITNAVYLNRRRQIVKYLVEKGVNMQISFDGTKDLNDLNRVMPLGTGSSGEILKTIAEIKKYGPLHEHASVRVTICKGMEDSIINSTKYLSDLGFRKIGFEPVEISGRAVGSDVKVDMKKFAINVVKAVVWGKTHDVEVISRVLPAANGRVMARFGCGFVAGRSISLTPDNYLYLCDDPLDQLRVGKVIESDGKYSLDLNYSRLQATVAQRDIARFPECDSCPVKCGGGCAKESLNHYKNMGHGGESIEFCDARRLGLLEYIKSSLTEDSLLSVKVPKASDDACLI